MTNDNTTRSALQQLIEDEAVGQLRRRDGLMATLGSEDGALKLDWVEGVARLLAHPAQLEQVEAEAQDIWQRGIRHIIWAGMGGSVIAVRVFCDLGFNGSPDEEQVTIYPLDSTDPAALNDIVRKIAAAKKLALPTGKDASDPTFLRTLLYDVMMVGVAMGMTSEEPITHLEWFTDLLQQAGLRPSEHLLVMTLPDSYLDRFAHEQQAPSLPLQPDGGTGTGGRMSAPTTRVFLLPAALFLTTHYPGQSGQLWTVLQHAWDEYNLELAASDPAAHPYVQLAAALSAASRDGACRLLVQMPEGWQVLVSWLEQLMEESLGKGGKGIVVFDDQTLNHAAPGYREDGLLRVHLVTQEAQAGEDQLFILAQPSLASQEPRNRLAALAASFLDWQLSMALYGYLQRITFAGQPAVENYKAWARALRTQPDPLQIASHWHPASQEGILTLLAPHAIMDQDTQRQIDPRYRGSETPGQAFARSLQEAASADNSHGFPQAISVGYLDLTVNGEAQAGLLSVLDEHVHTIGNALLGVPVKLRQAPAAYHSTEQSEMDGPSYLVSVRLVARRSEESLLGSYTNTFLHAQAVSTWQAMMEAGRPCFLLVIDGSLNDAMQPLATFFSHVEEYLHRA
jgi:nicotinamidase-related amidase